MSQLMVEKKQFQVKIIIKGKGGHSSVPYKTNNPIILGFEIINGINAGVAYKFNSFENFELIPIIFEAGTKENIIPEEARIEYKGISDDIFILEKLKSFISTTAEKISEAYSANVEITYEDIS